MKLKDMTEASGGGPSRQLGKGRWAKRVRPAHMTRQRGAGSCPCCKQYWNYLITLSALASTFGGIARPICFAAFRLMMNSNFIGCSTGRSAGLAPFRILSTYVAARRYKSEKFAP